MDLGPFGAIKTSKKPDELTFIEEPLLIDNFFGDHQKTVRDASMTEIGQVQATHTADPGSNLSSAAQACQVSNKTLN